MILLLFEYSWQPCAKSWKTGKMGSNTYKRTSASVIGCFGLSEQFLSSKFSTEWSTFLDLAPPFIRMVWSFHFAANERWCRLLVAQGIQFQFVISIRSRSSLISKEASRALISFVVFSVFCDFYYLENLSL